MDALALSPRRPGWVSVLSLHPVAPCVSVAEPTTGFVEATRAAVSVLGARVARVVGPSLCGVGERSVPQVRDVSLPPTGVIGLEEAAQLREASRAAGRVLVQCHGVFDLLHGGHVAHLTEARSFGDVLIVTITPDRFVNKGPGRPVFQETDRASLLAELRVVDYVLVTESPTAIEAIGAVRPDVFVKGPDYARAEDDVTGNLALERAAVEAAGGRFVVTSAPTMSSSALINAHSSPHGPEALQWLSQFKRRYSSSDAVGFLHRAAQLRVLVIGEAIVDEYVTCEAMGKSSKDPVLAFREIDLERQYGGSLAIANHCAGLGADVTVIARVGAEDGHAQGIRDALADRVDAALVESWSEPTIVKRRFIDSLTENRVFETYKMRDEPAEDGDDEAVQAALLSALSGSDVVLVADYGHGLITPGVMKILASATGVVAVNTQSNAGNRGFNTITRHERADLICLNGAEVALELRTRHLTIQELAPELGRKTGADSIVVTDGARGLVCFSSRDGVISVPALATLVRDRVGAGDAVFAVSALLYAAGAPLPIVGLFGNLAGASVIADLGNRVSVNAADLERHCVALLA